MPRGAWLQRRGRAVVVSCLCLWALLACGESTLTVEKLSDLGGPSEREFEVPDDGFVTDPLPPVLNDPGDLPLTLTRVKPASGSASGGAQVRLIGSAFVAGTRVFFGDKPVELVDTVVASSNEIDVVSPASEVGVVDVTVELPRGETVTLADAYTYHGLDIVPATGSPSGGTLVELTVTGRELVDGMELRFADAGCVGLEVVTPRRLRCQTPSGKQGPADLTLVYPDGESTTAADAFTYAQVSDSVNGGLSGPPIAGSVNVTVVDSILKLPIPGAWVLVGDDPSAPLRGKTDSNGRITLSEPGLTGPITVHVAFDCFESTSFVAFDAQNVVVLLKPTGELRCLDMIDIDDGDGGGGGGGGGTIGIAGARVSGQLRFVGPQEFASGGWDLIPPPRADEIRVAYVYASRSSVFASEIDPARGDAIQRIPEGEAAVDTGGYPYVIFVRPAGLAVYALAGIESTVTGRFTPYMMGVRRNVVTAPAVETTGIDIPISIQLDAALRVELTDLPTGGATGPLEYRVSASLDLGAEGFIVRGVRGRLIDSRSSTVGSEPFEFYGQPPLAGALRDARYSILAGWYSGDYSTLPYTEALLEGVNPQGGAAVVDTLLGIPRATRPTRGELLPEDRVLRWTADAAEPQLYVITLTLSDRTPVWTQIVPGTVHEVTVPDLSSLDGLSDLPEGFLLWTVRALRVRGFSFNQFDYGDLRASNWTHDAIDRFLFQVL